MRIKNISIFFLILMLMKGGLAQPELKIIGRITSTDGLLTDGIKYTYKDSQGFMWFTFEKGFQRWDGLRAKNYSYLSDTSLNSSYRYCHITYLHWNAQITRQKVAAADEFCEFKAFYSDYDSEKET